MGRDPLLLMVGDWTLETMIDDQGLVLMMHTSHNPKTTHFMRFDRKQAALLQAYLDSNLPSNGVHQ